MITVAPSEVGTSGDNGASEQANNFVEQKTIELTTSSCEESSEAELASTRSIHNPERRTRVSLGLVTHNNHLDRRQSRCVAPVSSAAAAIQS